MSALSPAAQAVLTALTQREYCLDPSDIPAEAGRMASIAAAALRAAAEQVVPQTKSRTDRAAQRRLIRAELLAIAAELEGANG